MNEPAPYSNVGGSGETSLRYRVRIPVDGAHNSSDDESKAQAVTKQDTVAAKVGYCAAPVMDDKASYSRLALACILASPDSPCTGRRKLVIQPSECR
jgi:hypothetical protein